MVYYRPAESLPSRNLREVVRSFGLSAPGLLSLFDLFHERSGFAVLPFRFAYPGARDMHHEFYFAFPGEAF